MVSVATTLLSCGANAVTDGASVNGPSWVPTKLEIKRTAGLWPSFADPHVRAEKRQLPISWGFARPFRPLNSSPPQSLSGCTVLSVSLSLHGSSPPHPQTLSSPRAGGLSDFPGSPESSLRRRPRSSGEIFVEFLPSFVYRDSMCGNYMPGAVLDAEATAVANTDTDPQSLCSKWGD